MVDSGDIDENIRKFLVGYQLFKNTTIVKNIIKKGLKWNSKISINDEQQWKNHIKKNLNSFFDD